MNSPVDPSLLDNTSNITPEMKDGFIASILGGLAMTARVMLSTEPVSFGFVCRRFLAASITAMFVGLGTKEYFHSTGLWLSVVGGAGYSAPEVADYFLKWVKAKGQQKINEITNETVKTTKKRRSNKKSK